MIPITQTVTEELKIFFFVVRPAESASSVLNLQEQGFSALAFNLDDANAQFINKFQGKEALNAKNLGFVLVKDIQSLVETKLFEMDKPEVKAQTTKEQFLLNMQLMAEEYVEDEKDAKTLNRIIKKMMAIQPS